MLPACMVYAGPYECLGCYSWSGGHAVCYYLFGADEKVDMNCFQALLLTVTSAPLSDGRCTGPRRVSFVVDVSAAAAVVSSFHRSTNNTSTHNVHITPGLWCPAAGKVTAGRASHWQCVTDLRDLSTKGQSKEEHRTNTPHEVWYYSSFTFTSHRTDLIWSDMFYSSDVNSPLLSS